MNATAIKTRIRNRPIQGSVSAVLAPRRGADRRSGMVLVVVLVIVTMLALAGFTFNELMLTEHQATRLRGRALETDAALESGVEMLSSLLQQRLDAPRGLLEDLPDAAIFRHVPTKIDEETGFDLRFSILAPLPGDDFAGQAPHYGPVGESARLNLHALLDWEQRTPGVARDALLQLPGMTIEAADSILDWMDPDDHPRSFGAEAAHYSALDSRFGPRNGVPQTIEELLLVRGVTPVLLLGSHAANVIDGSGARRQPLSRLNSRPDRFSAATTGAGWTDYLTLYSREANVASNGRPRINVNDDDLARLHRQLTADFGKEAADFIVLYRQFGPHTGGGHARGRLHISVDVNRAAKFRLVSIVELTGARVGVPQRRDREPLVVESPFGGDAAAISQSLPKLFDRLSVTDDKTILGRIDVNQAPREVLQSVPGLTPQQVERILARRQALSSQTPEAQATAAWLVTEGIVKLEEMKSMERYLTGRGHVFRARVVAYHNEKGPASQAEVVVDAAESPSRVVRWWRLAPLAAEDAMRAFGAADSEHMVTPRQGNRVRRVESREPLAGR